MSSQPQELDFHGRLEVAVRSLLSPTQGGRAQNEDNFLIIDGNGNARFLKDQRESAVHIPGWQNGHVRLAILDGMGGHSFGREAAERTVQGLLAIPATTNLGTLSDQLEKLHLRLHREMHVNGAEPGCTLTLLEIPASGPALLFHAGDSRLYAVNAEKTEFLTVDHVPATKFALFGMLDAAEWYRQVHELSGYQISQAFVLGNSLNTKDFYSDRLDNGLVELHDGNLPPFLQGLGDRRTLSLQPDVVYILASDGLWHLSQPLEFVRRWPTLLSQPNKSLGAALDDLFLELIETTRKEPRLRGDNCTAVAFRLPPPGA